MVKMNRARVMAIPAVVGAVILGAAAPLAAQQPAPAQPYAQGAAPGVTATPNRQMQPTGTPLGLSADRTQAAPPTPMAPSSGASTGTQLSLEQGRPSVADRMDKDQREMELVQTSLLNRFGGMGFAEMRNFRKIGENYAAEVRTVEGVWINVLIDPATGAVTVQQ